MVIAYCGQTRSRKLIAELAENSIREITQRDEYPPRRAPWALDNGAFSDWRAGTPFDEAMFLRAVESVRADRTTPDFVVVPDRVAEADVSLSLSLSWVPRLMDLGPLYLVVQDGMLQSVVAEALEPFAGIFVGGTLPWKLATGEQWVRFAHEHGRACHIGRVGTAPRVRWARRIGADSIDSSLPLWSKTNLRRFLFALRGTQGELAL